MLARAQGIAGVGGECEEHALGMGMHGRELLGYGRLLQVPGNAPAADGEFREER